MYGRSNARLVPDENHPGRVRRPTDLSAEVCTNIKNTLRLCNLRVYGGVRRTDFQGRTETCRLVRTVLP